MTHLGRLALAFAALIASGGPATAADVLAPPQWSSDQIRQARSMGPSAALLFDLEITKKLAGSPPQISKERVTLAPSFTLVTADDASVLEDRKLCRTLTWLPGGNSFQSDSCFAAPAFRVYELANRQVLQGMLSKIAPKSAIANAAPYWSEAELGVQEHPSDPLVRSEAGGVVTYRLGHEVAVRLTGSAAALTPDEMGCFVSFLARHSHLHPQVRRDLKATTAIPGTIDVATELVGKRGLDTLVVSNVRREQIPYPLPAALSSGLSREADKGDTPRAKGLQQALLAVAGSSKVPRPEERQLVTSMHQAVTSHRPLDALFLFFQLTQQYGVAVTNDAQLLQEVRTDLVQIMKDPGVKEYWAANDLAGSSQAPGDRQLAAKYLSRVDVDGLPFKTFRLVTFANLVRGSGDTSKWDQSIFGAMPTPLVDNYWLHIAAYPWASNAYKDLGDDYEGEFDYANAWLAYDLGRVVDKDWRSGVMLNVSKFEDQLVGNQPDFF